MSRKIRAAFAVALAAAGLTGCAGLNGYSVREETASQQDVIGDVVQVAATLCLDDNVDYGTGDALRRGLAIPANGDGSCDADQHQAGFAQGFADNGGVQFFSAFLVPDSAKAPATATAALPAGFDAATATLTRKPSLDETLQHTRPAPAGQRWVGYISSVLGQAAEPGEGLPELAAGLRRIAESDAPAASGDGDWSVSADFTPARGDGGLPAPATFAHAVLGGMRLAYPESVYDGVNPYGLDAIGSESFGLQLLDSRPVDCQEHRGFPFAQLYGVGLDSATIDAHGLPLIPTTLCGRTSTAAALALKDLRGSGGEATVAPGATAKVPFTLRYVGDAGPSFALSATTAVPGASASPAPAVLTPTEPGFQDAPVTVAVPAGTAPGAYAVTLTATVGGQVRTARGTVNVVAATSAAATPAADQEDDADAGGVAGASALPPVPARQRMLEFRGFDRSGVGPDGKSINLGDVLCHKAEGTCGWATVQLTVRWEQLHAGAETTASAAAGKRVRMVTIGTARLSVPAQSRRRVKVTLPPSVLKLLKGGEVLQAVAAVRPARNRAPMVHRIALRRG